MAVALKDNGAARPGVSGSAGYVRGQSGGVARVGNDVYAARDGTVYRNIGSGWQENSGGGWSGVSNQGQAQSMGVEQQIRSTGQTRVNNYNASGGSGRGGGARGGGRRR